MSCARESVCGGVVAFGNFAPMQCTRIHDLHACVHVTCSMDELAIK